MAWPSVITEAAYSLTRLKILITHVSYFHFSRPQGIVSPSTPQMLWIVLRLHQVQLVSVPQVVHVSPSVQGIVCAIPLYTLPLCRLY